MSRELGNNIQKETQRNKGSEIRGTEKSKKQNQKLL
jgi:hypothetical protein